MANNRSLVAMAAGLILASSAAQVTVTAGCEISDMHTVGGCMIKGIPNHWW